MDSYGGGREEKCKKDFKEKRACMKQKKRMLLLVGILVVLCGTYGGIKAWNNQMKTQKAAKKKAQTVQIIDADDLTKISYKKRK